MNDPRTWYEIKNSAQRQEDGTPAQTEVLLYGEIGGFGISAAQFLAELGQVPRENRLFLRIHSAGGSVLDGNAIFTALRNWPGGVTTKIDGLAASMASVIAIAGEPVQMSGNGILMIHRVNAGASGTPDDLRKMADTAEKIESTIVAAYTGKTGMSKRRITEMMDAETWMTATEAHEMGFVDEITGELKMAAHFDLSQFKNQERLTQLVAAMSQTATKTDLELLIEARAGFDTLEGELATAKELISLLETDKAELLEKVTKYSGMSETLTGEVAGKIAQILELEGKISELSTLNSQLTTDLAAAKSSTDSKAMEIAARNGANLPLKDNKAGSSLAGGNSAKQMSRADFEALTPSDQGAFCRAGGTLTD